MTEKLNKTMNELQNMADFKNFGKETKNEITKMEHLTAEEFWNLQPPMKNIPDAITEYYQLMVEHEGQDLKIGMYGEMPKIQIGKYTIAEMSNEENCTSIWIEDTTSGKGGQFNKDTFLKCLEEYFLKHF